MGGFVLRHIRFNKRRFANAAWPEKFNENFMLLPRGFYAPTSSPQCFRLVSLSRMVSAPNLKQSLAAHLMKISRSQHRLQALLPASAENSAC
jgi:hypothetical protein